MVATTGNSVSLIGLDQSRFTDRVFVYGKEVNDFRVVDYDAISMLNVSATQELAKRSEAQAKEIEQLKKLLLKKDLDAMVLDSYLEVAAEDLGYKSVAELKKKLSIKP